MLFQSVEFIFIFLPIFCLAYLLLRKLELADAAKMWVVFGSFVFYSWWHPPNIFLLLFSITANYLIGAAVQHTKGARDGVSHRKHMLAFGVAINLGLLGYFKYWNFFLENAGILTGSDFTVQKIVLPLAISFFTFQQIAFLVDRYRGDVPMPTVLDYCFFVSFFPQLIAGPIVLAREIFPQLATDRWMKPNTLDFSVGLTFFVFGVFKKVFFGDKLAVIADNAFAAAAVEPQAIVVSWVGVLAFSLQIYFDFSGYSDMAVGLARMFGIRIPYNFNSPYKASSIIDFWRRWHMTLSRFLRDYLYIPLGGNRKGPARRYVNLMIVMLLGGLWHGAGWGFVIWGGLHGAYLAVNHAWRESRFSQEFSQRIYWKGMAWLLTTAAVTFAWVFFRAEDMDMAANVFAGMFGESGVLITLPEHYVAYFGPLVNLARQSGVEFANGQGTVYFVELAGFVIVPLGAMFVLVMPNTQEYVEKSAEMISPSRKRHAPVARYSLLVGLARWRPDSVWGFALASLMIWLTLQMNVIKSFVYFEF